jgi:cis-L-3-hydroxyproline dehydratase
VRVTRVDVFGLQYTRIRAATMSGVRSPGRAETTLVRLATDEGVEGWGEVCPFGSVYMQSFVGGARAALAEMAPALIGADPCQLDLFYSLMDGALAGHGYAKSALDIAAWDVAGKAANLPVAHLLGGTFQERFPLYAVVSLAEPSEMAERAAELVADGYRRFQLKVGDDWQVDVDRVKACLGELASAEVVIADANTGWSLPDAVLFAAELDGAPIYIEQPCVGVEACAALRHRSRRPLILDESLTSLEALHHAHSLEGLDAAMLKLSRLGGISRVRAARDLCAQWGLRCTIEDAGGGDVVAAAMAQCTASTRPANLLNGWLTNLNVRERIAEGAPVAEGGFGILPRGPGLGLTVDASLLGEPIFSVG